MRPLADPSKTINNQRKTNMKRPTTAYTTTGTAPKKTGPAPDEIKIEAKRIEPLVTDDHIQKMIAVELPNGEVKIASKQDWRTLRPSSAASND